jgi:hypothetical protein
VSEVLGVALDLGERFLNRRIDCAVAGSRAAQEFGIGPSAFAGRENGMAPVMAAAAMLLAPNACSSKPGMASGRV